ncbi:MAG: DegT/DnrJ/EryC1/StrS family aminotransferase [Candidatus Krumholzibacteriota bacterium]|nr:DegT/DnrJ/EryC1/StrS family aminotransferase [Candidatus Krumholzibacteriota bacterium]
MEVRLLDLKSQYKGIRDEIEKAVKEVLESQYFILGPRVAEFEETVASYCGVSNGIGVASGSDAILISLMALGTGPGDEVITTPYTFFSTVSSITRLGATPVMVDIDPKTYNIDPVKVAEAVTSRTKAVLPVHLFGQTADMDGIEKAVSGRGIPVIEDACQSIGATYNGKRAGSLGIAGCFSFFPSKNLGGCGDGGMIVSDDAEFASKCRMLRNHGGHERYYHDVVGINSRLDAIQAAVLGIKMKYLDEWSSGRRMNASYYNEGLAGIEGVSTPFVEDGNESIFNQYIIRTRERDNLKAHLGSKGIGCEIYYPVPLHLQKCFSYLGGKEGDLPASESAAKETLALPVYTELSRTEQDYVIECISEFMISAGRA